VSKHCRARTKAGKPCKAVAVDEGLCAFHADPKRAAQLGRIGPITRKYLPKWPDNVQEFAISRLPAGQMSTLLQIKLINIICLQ